MVWSMFFLAFVFVRREEALVGGVAHEVEAEEEGVAFDFLEFVVVGGGELALEDFESVEAEFGGVVEAGGEGAEFLAAEAPEGIGGDADAVGSGVFLGRR